MKQPSPSSTISRHAGFTLVELTIVLVIVALLSGGFMMALSGQRNQIQTKEAQQQLDTIREALLGFAMSHGRLPCPANPDLPATGGSEDIQPCANAHSHISGYICVPVTDTQCAREHGVLPWRTLGLPETDVWGNRFTYFSGYEFSDPLLKAEADAGKRARFTLETVGRANILDGAGNNTATAIPAVVVSHGPRGAGSYQTTGTQLGGVIGDEAENADADLGFIAHTPNDSFDDQLTWIIPTVLKSRTVSVGKLP